MTEPLIVSLAWPLVAWFAICAAITGAVLFRFPIFAGARLDAAQALLAAQAESIAELRRRISHLESGRSFDETSVERLRAGQR